MLNNFLEHTRCPEGVVAAIPGLGGGRSKGGAVPDDASTGEPGRTISSSSAAAEFVANLQRVAGSEAEAGRALAAMDSAIDLLRLERYIRSAPSQHNRLGVKELIGRAYYLLRPLFPVAFRKHLQRFALRDWDSLPFPAWPVDCTTERLMEATWKALLTANGTQKLPFIWFWPDGLPSACIMTHDVETAVGRDFCGTLMDVESRLGIVSAFEVVPEERYPVPEAYLQEIRDRGCEVCIHGLNHDGRLFSSEEVFLARAKRINRYAEDWGARGFRSPVMYRNLEWLHALRFSYDMSVPNVAHLDPQRGGCCTVMPYFIGDIVELPLTTVQDYSLFNILQQRSLEMWKRQVAITEKEHGLVSFIIHPDYVTEPWAICLYGSLLELLAQLRADKRTWLTLPGAVDAWWRARRRMRLVSENGRWKIVGPEAERARIAYASMEDGAVVYRIEGPSGLPSAGEIRAGVV